MEVNWGYPGEYHHGNKPWSKKKRNIPLRTFSGQVVYKKSKRAFTQSDVERISKSVIISIPPEAGIDWQRELILFLQRVTIRMLEKILPFISEETISYLYYMVYEILGQFFRVDTGYITNGVKTSIIFDTIQRLASLGNLDVTVKRKQ